MEQPAPNKSQIRGKDLAGAIKVMPMGLDAAIKKRASGEFKSEPRGGTVTFSNAEHTSSVRQESRQLQTCPEDGAQIQSVGTPFQQAGFNSAPMRMQEASQMQGSSAMQSSSMKQQTASSFGVSSSHQMSSSASQKSMMTSSSSSSKSMSMQSSSTMRKDFGETVKSVSHQSQIDSSKMEHQEIGQGNLKTQLESCITDLEKDRDFVDFNKENKPINLASPPRNFSPVPAFSPRKQEAFSPVPQPKADMFSPPPLEPMELPQSKAAPAEPHLVPASFTPNGVSNGFSDIGSTGSKNMEVQQQFQSSSSFQQSSSVQQVLNGSFEETGSVQGSSSSSSLLQKIMTPAPTEYDSGSLKRRDPRKMFTDSSFYSAKHHPTVADQVEMAHKLSSAMFNESNKSTKGQQMFLSRVQNAGDEEIDLPDNHGKLPNLKHVMNPEGRTVEWGDVTQEEQANMEMMSGHAVPNFNTPDPIAESLNAETGKGENALSRPSTFVSAYRRVFEKNRVVFGAEDSVTKGSESPRLKRKSSPDTASQKVAGTGSITNKNTQTTCAAPAASPNLNKNRAMTQKGVITSSNPTNSKDSNVRDCKGKDSQEVIEMKPVTVRIKDSDHPVAPPRKAHFQDEETPKKKPHFIETQKPLDNRTSTSLMVLNNKNISESSPKVYFSPLDNRAPLRRHASFNEKNVLDNRPSPAWGSNNMNVNTRPSDVLKTPYLLSSSSRALHHQSNQNVRNFPHIPSTSMVAKTKALFEATSPESKNRNFVPLTKSRTFSSFPTESSPDSGDDGPLTPSVPQRISSRKVFDTYKSMTGNINNCGMDTSSPGPQRRIPMASFF